VRVPRPAAAPAPPDAEPYPFTVTSLRETGVLRAARWTCLPEPATDPVARMEAEGREVFRLLCRSCHTTGGYLAIRPLVARVSWAAAATILNFLPGFWWLVALPREALLALLGHEPLAAFCFAAGVLASLGALALLVPAAFAPEPRRLLYGADGSLGLALVLMVLVRDSARRIALAPTGFGTTAWVVPQWGPIAVFGALLVAAAVAVVWMVVKLARGTPARSPHDAGV